MPDITAVVFDFDGVLANSEPLHLRAYQQVLDETGVFIERDEYYQRYLGFDDVGAFRAIGEAHGQYWSTRRSRRSSSARPSCSTRSSSRGT